MGEEGSDDERDDQINDVHKYFSFSNEKYTYIQDKTLSRHVCKSFEFPIVERQKFSSVSGYVCVLYTRVKDTKKFKVKGERYLKNFKVEIQLCWIKNNMK